MIRYVLPVLCMTSRLAVAGRMSMRCEGGVWCSSICLQLSLCLSVFTARRYASAVLAVIVCLSVRPSVCPSVCHKSELYKDG